MLQAGQMLTGKWTGTRFQVERALGSGANGDVYLIQTDEGTFAMKTCRNAGDIALEWGLLEKLSALCEAFPKPAWIDDVPPNLYFYVMEWIPGVPLHEAAKQMDAYQFHETIEQLLVGLETLHQSGQAFCDVKPENILVQMLPRLEARFVDVGGVTTFGRAVRQLTPYHDRGFWGMGSRKSDASYDLFALALAVLFCSVTPPVSLVSKPPSARRVWLERCVRTSTYGGYKPLLSDVIAGRVSSAAEFRQRWNEARPRSSKAQYLRGQPVPSRRTRGRTPLVKQGASKSSRRNHAPKRVRDWTEWLMWISLGMAATVTITAWGTYMGWLSI